jgi:NADP-dependent 3-hydroxy acid dehydrogenase YdfG
MSTLSDKVAIITGASSGIGQAAAVELARQNAKIVLAARRSDRLEALTKQIVEAGGHALPVVCDVAQRSQVKAVIDRTVETFGRIDILINNAGVMPLAPMAKCRMDDWDYQIDINIKGLLYGIGYALPHMLEQKSGHIINVSSVAGRIIFPGAAVYCGTKHAVHAITDGLRSELAERSREDGSQIRVTVIAPGVVTTELADSILDEETREGAKAYYGSMPGPLTSEDIAASILYALTAPPHVDVSEILIRPTAQVR